MVDKLAQQFPFSDKAGNTIQGQTLSTDDSGFTTVSIGDGRNATVGSKADAAVVDPTAAGSAMAFFKGLLTIFGKKDDAVASDPAANNSLISLAKGVLAAFGKPNDPEFSDVNTISGPVTAISLLKAIASRARNPTIAFGENFIGYVGASTMNAVATVPVVRPSGDTSALTVGDMISANAAPGSSPAMIFPVARKNGGTFVIDRARLNKSFPKTENAFFRLRLYRTNPTAQSGSGDNLPFKTDASAGYLGAIDFACDEAFSDGAKGFGVPKVGAVVGPPITGQCEAGSKNIYGFLSALGTYTPDAGGETFTPVLEGRAD